MATYAITVGQTFTTKIQGQESDGTTSTPQGVVVVTTSFPDFVTINQSGPNSCDVSVIGLKPGTIDLQYTDGSFSTSDTLVINPAPVVEDGLVSIPQ